MEGEKNKKSIDVTILQREREGEVTGNRAKDRKRVRRGQSEVISTTLCSYRVR